MIMPICVASTSVSAISQTPWNTACWSQHDVPVLFLKSCLTGSNWYSCILAGLSGKVSVFRARVGHFAATPQSDVVGIWSGDLGMIWTCPLIMFSNLLRIRNNSFHTKKTANLCTLILHVLMLVVFNSSVKCTSLGLIWEWALSKTPLLLLVPQTSFPQTFPPFESQTDWFVSILSVRLQFEKGVVT